MERNPWKLATIGLALVGTTALGTGLTTAYVLRQPTEAPAVDTAPTRTIVTPRAVGAAPAVVRPAATPVVPRATPVATTPTVAADCATGKDRAMKIAKPGVIGGLLGAVLGGGYGAYHTKSECGTIFGNTFSAPATSAAAPVPFDGKGITVYNAR